MGEAERLASPGTGNGTDADLGWLLDDLVTRVAQIDKALILSRDGLAIGASQGFTREDAEHLSAVAAGFQSLARGAGQHFGGGRIRQTIVEMDNIFLFVTSAGEAAAWPCSARPRPTWASSPTR